MISLLFVQLCISNISAMPANSFGSLTPKPEPEPRPELRPELRPEFGRKLAPAVTVLPVSAMERPWIARLQCLVSIMIKSSD